MKNTAENGILHSNIVIEEKEKELERSMMREHYHDYDELYFFRGDRMRYFVSGTAYDVRGGGFVFIDRFTYHRTTYLGQDKRRAVISFRRELLDAFADKEPFLGALSVLAGQVAINLSGEAAARAEELALRLLEAYGCGDKTLTVLLFATLLLTLSRYASSTALPPSRAEEGENAARVGEVVAYINAHYAEKLTLASLSEQIFVDKFHLCHIFKRITGMSVLAFINGKRLAEARRLLLSTDRRVGEIAAAVGFANQNHFNTLFRATYGQTPTELRANGKGL